MNFTPEYFKERTDASLSLFDEIQGMDIDELKLKPREAKGLYQVSEVGLLAFVGTHCQPM
jgi:hypothetical protein